MKECADCICRLRACNAGLCAIWARFEDWEMVGGYLEREREDLDDVDRSASSVRG
jgi:hypothetical protein